MFDLNRAIKAWRQKMSARGITSPEVLDELEAHLLEDIERRTTAGADAQAAFEAATEAVGQPELLRGEFAKLDATRGLRRWFRICFYVLPLGMLLLSAWTLLIYETPPLEWTVGILVNSFVCVCLIRWPQFCAALRAVAGERFARAIKLASGLVLFWPILALLDALHYLHLRLGIVASVVFWNL